MRHLRSFTDSKYLSVFNINDTVILTNLFGFTPFYLSKGDKTQRNACAYLHYKKKEKYMLVRLRLERRSMGKRSEERFDQQVKWTTYWYFKKWSYCARLQRLQVLLFRLQRKFKRGGGLRLERVDYRLIYIIWSTICGQTCFQTLLGCHRRRKKDFLRCNTI